MQRGLLQEFALGDRRQTFYIEMVQIKERKSASNYHFSNMPLHKIPVPILHVCRIILSWLSKAHFDTFHRQQLHLHSSKKYVVTATSTVKHASFLQIHLDLVLQFFFNAIMSFHSKSL